MMVFSVCVMITILYILYYVNIKAACDRLWLIHWTSSHHSLLWVVISALIKVAIKQDFSTS